MVEQLPSNLVARLRAEADSRRAPAGNWLEGTVRYLELAADEIERLRAVLAGEAGLVELVASRPHFTETDRLTILGNHRHLDALAVLDADEICREHAWCALDKGHPGLCNSNRYGVADETSPTTAENLCCQHMVQHTEIICDQCGTRLRVGILAEKTSGEHG